jgi:glycosyltransferase involved in cell wall biosynthesis
MATYNGAPFVAEQLRSILRQLDSADEIVVVDDSSRDNTVAVIESMADRRIRLLRNTRNLGVTRTFERALQASTKPILLLSDQDDVWHEEKLERMIREFQNPAVTLCISNAVYTDENGNRMPGFRFEDLHEMPGLMRTIMQNRYQGSLMAFRREILAVALPFPYPMPMHDWWLGVVNAAVGKAVYINEPLMDYRRHSATVTKEVHGTVPQMLKQRLQLVAALIRRFPKILNYARMPRA